MVTLTVFLSQLLHGHHSLNTGMVSGSVNGDIATKAVLEAAKAVAGQHFLPLAQSLRKINISCTKFEERKYFLF